MGNKILVLLGPLTLFWHGVDNLKKMGYEVVVHDMIENGSGLEAIVELVEAEKPDLVAIDGCFPLRAAAAGRILTERSVKCLPILLSRDLEKRRRRRDGITVEVSRPIIDMLHKAFSGNCDEFLAFDKRGDITDLKMVLDKIFSSRAATGAAEENLKNTAS